MTMPDEPREPMPSDPETARRLEAVLRERFGEEVAVDAALDGLDELLRLTTHRVHHRYSDRPVDRSLVRLLCACALSAPSESDLQQRDIMIVSDPGLRRRIAGLLPHMPWVGEAPAFLVFCADGRPAACPGARRCGASRSRTTISTCSSTPSATPPSRSPPASRRRGGRPRLLPDQRGPQSRRAGERMAGAPGARHSLRGLLHRLAGRRGPDQPTPAPLNDGAREPL